MDTYLSNMAILAAEMMIILQFGADAHCYVEYRTRSDLWPTVGKVSDISCVGLALGSILIVRLLYKSFKALDYPCDESLVWRGVMSNQLVSTMLLQALVESIPSVLINRHVVSSVKDEVRDSVICCASPLLSVATVFVALQIPSALYIKHQRRHVPLETRCLLCLSRICLFTARLAVVYFALHARNTIYKLCFLVFFVFRVLLIGPVVGILLPKEPDSFRTWFTSISNNTLLTVYSMLTPILEHDGKDRSRFGLRIFIADQVTLMLVSMVLDSGEVGGENAIVSGNREIKILSVAGLLLLLVALRIAKNSRAQAVIPEHYDSGRT